MSSESLTVIQPFFELYIFCLLLPARASFGFFYMLKSLNPPNRDLMPVNTPGKGLNGPFGCVR